MNWVSRGGVGRSSAFVTFQISISWSNLYCTLKIRGGKSQSCKWTIVGVLYFHEVYLDDWSRSLNLGCWNLSFPIKHFGPNSFTNRSKTLTTLRPTTPAHVHIDRYSSSTMWAAGFESGISRWQRSTEQHYGTISAWKRTRSSCLTPFSTLIGCLQRSVEFICLYFFSIVSFKHAANWNRTNRFSTEVFIDISHESDLVWSVRRRRCS